MLHVLLIDLDLTSTYASGSLILPIGVALGIILCFLLLRENKELILRTLNLEEPNMEDEDGEDNDANDILEHFIGK